MLSIEYLKKLNPHNYPEVGTIIILLYAGGN